ncbi:MAG: tRNA-binding protein [Clostridiales bacterium]|nr:MAG: tRNA-binding protein [Clostridiales bacterium]
MAAEVKKEISMKDLQKIDIRCGTILDVQDIEASDSLVKLTVDLGEEQPRTILCGMKNERQNTAEIIGKQALFVVNLKPREMFGYTSHGMLFDIGYEDGIKPALAMPEWQVPNGSRAG